ncbi:MAG TPA: S1/P1 nuclease [Pyrinomonadaceae bacterium]
MRKRVLFSIVSVLCLIAASPSRVGAWGQSGHRITALIAAEYLDDAARAEVGRLLGGSSSTAVATKMSNAANWPDTIIGQRPETARWHFVNISRDATGYDASQHCEDVPGKGDCIVEAIARNRETLADASRPDAARREALKFLIHFLGDIHQPLHAGFPEDRGGNLINVRFFGAQTNLHKVWDSGIIGQAQLSDREFADALLEVIPAANVASIQGGTPVEWAEQSWQLSKSNAYRIPPNKRLGQTYYDRNWFIVDDQLTRGGLRLARLLNEAL